MFMSDLQAVYHETKKILTDLGKCEHREREGDLNACQRNEVHGRKYSVKIRIIKMRII